MESAAGGSGTEVGSPRPAEVTLVVVGGGVERTVPVWDRLFLGRTCQGIDEAHRLLLTGDNISRDHCQILLDAGGQGATLVDTSTNGTRLNGMLIERSVPVPLGDGDVVAVGTWSLTLRTATPSTAGFDPNLTMRQIDEGRVCVVCGDLLDYTTLTEQHGGQAVFAAMHVLFDRLRALLRVHYGTLYDYVGDAFLAMWEEEVMPDAAQRGVAFAVAATAEIAAVAPTLSLRGLDGGPLRMGWAVSYGTVARSAYAGSLAGLLGDAVNTGFRLASLAGRHGYSPVLVTEEAVAAGVSLPGLLAPEVVTVKGKAEPVGIRQVQVGVVSG